MQIKYLLLFIFIITLLVDGAKSKNKSNGDKNKEIKKKGKMLNIPTEKDVEEYIMNKIKETNGKEKIRS